MKQRTICKTLAVAVILLFIGVSVNPAIAVKSDSTDSDDDCDLCPKVSNQQIYKLKSIESEFKIQNNKISLLYEQNPETSKNNYSIKSIYTNLNTITDWETTPYKCLFLIIIFFAAFGLAEIVQIIQNTFNLWYGILENLFWFLFNTHGWASSLFSDLGCDPEHLLLK